MKANLIARIQSLWTEQNLISKLNNLSPFLLFNLSKLKF